MKRNIFENASHFVDKSTIRDWIKNHLEGSMSSFVIHGEDNIQTHEVVVTQPINEFPFRFRDVKYIKLNYANELKSLKNFPDSSQSELFIIFASGIDNITSVDFFELPQYLEVTELTLEFGYISNITTEHMAKYNNLRKVTLYRCPSPDLYDFEKYDITAAQYMIYPKKYRFKNLSAFVTNPNINIKFFRIEMATATAEYEKDEIIFLNNIFARYNKKSDHVMDYTLELIDNDFEDEI